MQQKQRCMILFFSMFKHFSFPLPVRFLLLKSLKLFTVGKVLQISADHHARVTALQVVRTSFLCPRPRLSPHLVYITQKSGGKVGLFFGFIIVTTFASCFGGGYEGEERGEGSSSKKLFLKFLPLIRWIG